MRATSYLAISSGSLFCALSLAAPSIMRWQAKNTLAQFGALDKLDLLVAVQIDPLRTGFMLSAIVCAAVVVAGVLMLFRRKSGFYLLIGLGVWITLNGLLELAGSAPRSGVLICKVIWWSMVLVLAVRQDARVGAGWWRAKATPGLS